MKYLIRCTRQHPERPLNSVFFPTSAAAEAALASWKRRPDWVVLEIWETDVPEGRRPKCLKRVEREENND